LEEKPGTLIGRYKLLEKVGEGGFGVVYVAEQREPVKRRVALKVIKLGMDTRQVVARFEAERQALALMDHPNIAKVFDAGATESGRPFFVMELVRGIKIIDYCDQNRLSTRQRLNLFIKVCQAIQHAHQKGIIHRDIKPSNILVTLHDGKPVPKVIDFGIVKATQGELTDKTVYTQLQEFIGTPAYMSPEQAEMSGLDIDTRADIYSLGVLLYELLTGKTPFDANELLAAGLEQMRRTIRETEPLKPSTRLTQELVAADLRRRPPKSGIPNPSESESEETSSGRQAQIKKLIELLRGDLDWIVMKCLEKDRTRRYETANGLASDVERYLKTEPVLARPPSRLYRFQKMVRRNKLAFGAAGAVAAALIIGISLSTSLFLKERQTRRRAVAAEGAQSRLRKEAETAAQTEAQLHQQAEANEKKAKAEAAKSRQVAQFLQEMLKSVGPSVALGRDATMLREILDKTAERIDKDLTHQPEVEAELRIIIGSVYYELFDLKKAEAMYRKALALRRTSLHEDPPLAVLLYNLGRVLNRQGTLTGPKALRQDQCLEAKALFEEAITMNRKLFGKEHPEIAKCMSELASFLVEDHSGEAEAMILEALAMQRKLLGNTNADVARSLENLAVIRWRNDDFVATEALWREVLAIYRSVFGPEHPEVARMLGAVADMLNRQGKHAEAEATWREALMMGEKFVGEEHFFTSMTRGNLMDLLRNQGRLTELERLLQDELLRAVKLYGNTEKLANPCDRLGDFLLSQHKFNEAQELLDTILTPAIMNQPRSARLLQARGNMLARTCRWKEAGADFSRMIELEPEDNWTYLRLAPLLLESGDVAAYRLLCARTTDRFASTQDFYAALTTVYLSLLSPLPGADLSTESRLADLTITTGAGDPGEPYFDFCKGFVEYRQKHFASAADWEYKSLGASNSWEALHVATHMVLSMAHHQLHQTEQARATMLKGSEIAETKLPKIESGDIGDDWVDWLIAHTLMREAKALIEGESKIADSPKPGEPPLVRREAR